MGKQGKDRRANAKPLSLTPLSFEQALSGLLKTKPSPKGEMVKVKAKSGTELVPAKKPKKKVVKKKP